VSLSPRNVFVSPVFCRRDTVPRRTLLTTPIIRRAWDPADAEKHIRSQVERGAVTAVSGEELQLPIGEHHVSLCCHSDSPGAVEIVTAARRIVDEFNRKTFGE
jgi:lactam utilization protein B